MNINTENRDVRDVGICAGVAILANIVWGLSSDLINAGKAKRQEKKVYDDTLKASNAIVTLTADIEAYLATKTLALKDVVDNNLIETGKLILESGSKSQEEIFEGLIAKYRGQDAVLETPSEVEATFPGMAAVVEDVVTHQAVPVEVKDLGTFGNAAGEAVEALASLLEDPEATNKELADAQDLCKVALKCFQEMINLLESQGGDQVLVDHQYRYANILSRYELKLPALKKARATNGRKAKQAK